jgi:hypothetical protein
MKNFSFAVAFVLITTYGLLANAAETKKVCHEQKDNKGKAVRVCKEVKLHKKLDAVKVPQK